MPRPRTGQARFRFRNGRWYARVSLEGGARSTFALSFTRKADEARARQRARLLSQLADQLRV